MKTTLSFALLAACFAMPAFAGNDTTPAEVQNAEMHNEQTMSNGTMMDSSGNGNGGMMHHDHMMNHDMKKDMMFDKMDANHDGKISKDEAMSYAKQQFMAMDTNHDGYVTKDEMDAYHKQQWEMMHSQMQNGNMSNGNMSNGGMMNGTMMSK